MLDSFYTDLSLWMQGLGLIGLLIVLGLAFFHVTFEGPLALFLLVTTSLILDSIGWAIVLILLVHWAGLPLFYVLVHHLHRRTNRLMERVELTNQLLVWVDQQPRWKHMIVIGLPFIVTYPVKLALTIKAKSFKDYMITLMGSYGVLMVGNLLIYFGALGALTERLPPWVSVLSVVTLALLIYFGRSLTLALRSKV